MEKEIHYCLHKSPPVECVLSQLKPAYSFKPSLRLILKLSPHLQLCLPNALFPLGFQSKTVYAFLIYLMQAPRTADLNLFMLFTLVIFGEDTHYEDSRCVVQHPVIFNVVHCTHKIHSIFIDCLIQKSVQMMLWLLVISL